MATLSLSLSHVTTNATTPTASTSFATNSTTSTSFPTSVSTSITNSPLPYPSRAQCSNVPPLNIEKNIPRSMTADVISCLLDMKKNNINNKNNDDSCGDSRLSFTTVSTAVNTSTCNTANVSTNTSANPILSPADSLRELSIDKISKCLSNSSIVKNNNTGNRSVDKNNDDKITKIHSLGGGVPITSPQFSKTSTSIPDEVVSLNANLSSVPASICSSSQINVTTPLSLLLPVNDTVPVSVPIPYPIPNPNLESLETLKVKNLESESESTLRMGTKTERGTRTSTPSWAAVGGYDHPQPGSRLLQYGERDNYKLFNFFTSALLFPHFLDYFIRYQNGFCSFNLCYSILYLNCSSLSLFNY